MYKKKDGDANYCNSPPVNIIIPYITKNNKTVIRILNMLSLIGKIKMPGKGGSLMENNKNEFEMEKERLKHTISLAKNQLNRAKHSNEEKKTEIIAAKKELRDNTSHSIPNLWSSEGFEALAALNQYINPVTDKLAEYEATENKIALLENLIKAPYFARIDFEYNDDEAIEKIYIGRSSLMDENTYDMYVYDWRSPVASVFYRFVTGQAYYDAPCGRIEGELKLKRQYEINNGILEYFFDADVQIVDEFLRKLLSQNASSKMKTVVETIQREQDIIIRDMENDLMMVQGVAGSGKTSIALHRAAYLMYQELSSGLNSNNIIIISPNSLFENYISNVLPELGEDNVVTAVLEELLSTVLQNKRIQTKNKFLEILITNGRYQGIMKSCMEFKTSVLFIGIMNRFIDDLPNKWIEFEDVFFGRQLVASKEDIKEKILSGRKTVPLGIRLKQLEDFILESARELHKINRNKFEYLRIKKEVKKFTELDVNYLYNILISDDKYFYSLATGLELPDYIGDILSYTRENIKSGALNYDDAAVLAYLKIKLNGISIYKNIRQVIIDEAQDYYPLHFEIFKLMFINAKYTVLGDINQTLEKQEDLSLYEQIEKILNKKKSLLVTMDKSFRCTNEILVYSSKFINYNVEIKSFNRVGEEPMLYETADEALYENMIITEVEKSLADGYRSVGLICKTENNAALLYSRIKDRINVRLVKNESEEDIQGVFIIPVYMSKGLEFDAVLICDANCGNYNSEEDKKLLYIACTRALHRLNLFCEGEASRLL